MPRDYEDIFDTEDLDDNELRQLVRETLRDNRSIDPKEIIIHVQDGKVILTGRVGTDAEKQIAERVVTDRIGLDRVESQLVVIATRRAESPEAVDESLVDEEAHEGLLLGGDSLPFDDTSRHLEDDQDAELYGTVDRTEAMEEGVTWIPPESSTPEGLGDGTGPAHDADRD